AGVRGASTALTWIQREDEPGEAFFFGTQNGFLICWRQGRYTGGSQEFEEIYCQQLTRPAEITGVAFDSASN
ncbi:hypothetical protein B0H10DRAFT_1744265, partial [Mycena sp. CBHHK59/15]